MVRKANGSSALHFDAIVALIESGMSIRAACDSNPDFPKQSAIEKFVARHPERQARLRAAIEKRESGDAATGYTGRQFTDADYESALATIAAGRHRNSADSLTVDHPGQRMILDRATRDPAFGARYKAALAGRHDPCRFADAAYDLALRHLRRIDKSIQTLALGLSSDLPNLETIYRRCNVDPEFAGQFDKMLADRTAARRAATPRRETWLLRKSLALNELYVAAMSAVGSRFPMEIREEIAAEIIVAVLGGDIEQSEIRARAPEFVRQHFRGFGRFISLDRRVRLSDEDDISFADSFTTCDFIA
jgi:hypothetical protein